MTNFTQWQPGLNLILAGALLGGLLGWGYGRWSGLGIGVVGGAIFAAGLPWLVALVVSKWLSRADRKE